MSDAEELAIRGSTTARDTRGRCNMSRWYPMTVNVHVILRCLIINYDKLPSVPTPCPNAEKLDVMEHVVKLQRAPRDDAT